MNQSTPNQDNDATSRRHHYTNERATSRAYTAAEVKRHLHPAFLLAETDDRLLLDAYADAVGRDVAASDLDITGAFLSEQDAWTEGFSMAAATLEHGACTTDDASAFTRRYQAAFYTGSLSHCELAHVHDGAPAQSRIDADR